jgi:8-oxo-dGTP diphosphatase
LGAPESSAPRVRVAALLTYDDAVVLVRHRKGDSTYHLLPGGGVAWGETLAEALVREVAEETGFQIAPRDLLIVSDTIAPDGARHVVNMTFAADIIGGAITADPADDRVEAVELVQPDRLAALDLRPPIAGPILAALNGVRGDEVYVGSVFTPG